MLMLLISGVSHVVAFPEIVIASLVELKKLSFRVVKHQTMVSKIFVRMLKSPS